MNGTWPEVRAWRAQQRERLIAERAALAPSIRRAWNVAINTHLKAACTLPAGAVIGFFRAFRDEVDTRLAIRHMRARGALAALPVVMAKTGPLEFHRWWPGAPMVTGTYGIPVPDGTDVLVPDVVLVPMNGFDDQGYRLGYGGGYFDRTLAAMAPPFAIGVAYACARLATVRPQPHDVAMDVVVTEAGLYAVVNGHLEPKTAGECRLTIEAWFEERRAHERRALARRCCSSPPCYADEFPEYFGGEPEDTARRDPRR